MEEGGCLRVGISPDKPTLQQHSLGIYVRLFWSQGNGMKEVSLPDSEGRLGSRLSSAQTWRASPTPPTWNLPVLAWLRRAAASCQRPAQAGALHSGWATSEGLLCQRGTLSPGTPPLRPFNGPF
jgi:hypothetical protein